MENEEPKITFESIMRNWNARYNYGAKAQAQQSPKVRALNATMRNPETPAGTYPVFEAYLGVDVIEKATQFKRERKQKRKAFWKKTALWVAIGVPVSLVVTLLVIGAINFTSSMKREQVTAPSIAATATPRATATETSTPTATPTSTSTTVAVAEGTATATGEAAAQEQKHCLTTPTKSPFLDGNGALHYGKGTGRDEYYVPANEDCGVRYTAEDGSSGSAEATADSNSVGLLVFTLVIGLGAIFVVLLWGKILIDNP
jgi:hypothetical protein